MTEDLFLCARCSRHRKTCCQTSEVYTTPEDVQRIAHYTNHQDFTEYRAPDNAEYADQDDDSAWQQYVFRSDGTRRVLRREADGDCTFLGEQGCRLPLEVRPLVCRLYPFQYTEAGIDHDLADGCPLELLRPGLGLLDELEMTRGDADRWHRQLYQEIRLEALE
ncbi:MAG: YkgJ family cysteine cluster protein [Planctomycetales bacterium]|nr:YkgJ family cysteine cluster protein [Planctomycetales bacterium]